MPSFGMSAPPLQELVDTSQKQVAAGKVGGWVGRSGWVASIAAAHLCGFYVGWKEASGHVHA